MKKLRIGQIAPLNLPVPPKKYGGTEKIIYFLCEELTKKGHEVFLFGSGDSKVSCHLVPIVKKGLWYLKPKAKNYYPFRYAVAMVEIAKKVENLKLDILHDHLGFWSLTFYGQKNIPIVHTLHVPFKNEGIIWAYGKLNAKLISVSFSQRKPAPNLNYVANIYNSIDVESFPFNEKPKDYFLWVGELSPRKGILEVIKLAKMARIKLILIGRIPPPQQKEDYEFFLKYVKKELTGNNMVKYLGELTSESLKTFYKNAIAFLYPLQWEEPFGLTVIESMACGTPVIAFKKGAMPEIIKNHKTGFVIKPSKNERINYNNFIYAIKNINKISRGNCRKWVEKNFTMERMVNDYEKIFYKIVSRT